MLNKKGKTIDIDLKNRYKLVEKEIDQLSLKQVCKVMEIDFKRKEEMENGIEWIYKEYKKKEKELSDKIFNDQCIQQIEYKKEYLEKVQRVLKSNEIC